MAFAADGQMLASASADRTIKLWDPRTGQELCTLRGHSATVMSVVFAPDSQALASASADNTIKIWDPATGKELLTLRKLAQVMSVACSPDGRRLAAAAVMENERGIAIFDASDGYRLHVQESRRRPRRHARSSPPARAPHAFTCVSGARPHTPARAITMGAVPCESWHARYS